MKQIITLPLLEAMDLSLEKVEKTTMTEYVLIENLLGRVLAQDITCVKNSPCFNNSAMDGFAVKAEDAGKRLHINKTIFAGDKGVTESLEGGDCYKIMTGAKVPTDANAIIPIENCTDVTETEVTIPTDIKAGDHLKLKGEEVSLGDEIVVKGSKITPAIIAMLSSQGIVAAQVYKKISIAVLSTGNELKEPWELSDDEEIYNSNTNAIISFLKDQGFEPTHAGVIPDSLQESIDFIAGLKNYDVVITTGGISMGDADFMAEAFTKNGLEMFFHGVNVKPGRPTMMGKMGKTTVLAMPGNPLTAVVNIRVVVIPILNKLQGDNAIYHNFSLARSVSTFKTAAKRANVVLGDLQGGEFRVTRENKYGSGMLMPLLESNALIITCEGKSGVNEGDIINVLSFTPVLTNKKQNILTK